jgi:hypothetical protein
MIGSNDTGFYRQGAITYLRVSGAFSMAWYPDAVVSWAPLNMGGQKINTLADPEAATDAVNLRTAEARYLPGPWFNFVPDPGWESNTIRYRLVGLTSLQIVGDIQAPLPANARARVGVLPEGARPSRNYRTPGICSSALLFGWALFELGPDGQLWTNWSLGDPPNNSVGSINAIIPMD